VVYPVEDAVYQAHALLIQRTFRESASVISCDGDVALRGRDGATVKVRRTSGTNRQTS
jgi:hypothetical protein